MSENLVLKELATASRSKNREARLEATLRALLCALDSQHFMNKPPGQYHYSGNVNDAIRAARSLVTTPVEAPAPEDVARACKW